MEETGETANLGIRQGDSVLFVSQAETHETIRAFFPPGTRSPLHASGIGKALLEYAEEVCRYAPDPFDHVWLVFDKDDFPADEFDRVERECAATSDPACTFHALWSNPCFEIWPLLHLRYTTAPMDAAACQKALADSLARGFGADYRKNMGGLFALIEPMRQDAEANAARLVRHHEEIGNDRPSSMNPGTRVAGIFEELGPYLGEVGN